MIEPSTRCPCRSGERFDACCGPLLAGESAPTAERLMRSRFTAFSLHDERYLLASWHPSTRPARVEFAPGLVWRGLQIVDTVSGREGDSEGIVEFRAAYRDSAGHGVLHERSRFARAEERWTYVDGDLLDQDG